MAERLRGLDGITPRSGPLTTELIRLFDAISADALIARLQKTVGRGPKGYAAQTLFNVFIASYYLNADSIAATVRALQDNPSLALACGLNQQIPSRPTLSRFFKRLSQESEAVKQVLATLTTRLRGQLPGFGEHLALDSTTVPTHSQPDHDPVSDPQGSWTAKGYKVGSTKKQWHFGYKLHLLADAIHELPIACYVTTAKSADSLNFLPLLDEAKVRFDWFAPETVAADKGYDAIVNYRCAVEVHGVVPIMPMRAMRAGAKKRRPGTKHRTEGPIPRDSDRWRALYGQRTSVERLFGRLKETRRLERHCYRGIEKVELHCLLSVLTLQAKAVVQLEADESLRQCLRKVA